MKVGDLVKVNTAGDVISIPAATARHGQLGVIARKHAGTHQWIVILMSGEKFWFEPKELEVQE
jgi:hypothetical protein